MKSEGEILEHLKCEVWVRLGVSKHGVGVFAIRDIPYGIDPFFEGKLGLSFIEISKDMIDNDPEIPHQVRKLLHDLCSVRNGKINFPSCGLNGVSPLFYMNHSPQPNVGIGGPVFFKALRPIKEGEELTSDYATYDDDCADVT